MAISQLFLQRKQEVAQLQKPLPIEKKILAAALAKMPQLLLPLHSLPGAIGQCIVK